MPDAFQGAGKLMPKSSGPHRVTDGINDVRLRLDILQAVLDRRVRSNKATARSTTAGDTHAEDEMHQWAKKRAHKVKQRVDAINARDVKEYASDEEDSDSELVCEDEGIDLVAALVIA